MVLHNVPPSDTIRVPVQFIMSVYRSLYEFLNAPRMYKGEINFKQAGWFLRSDCAPSSECPQFGMPPSFDRCTPPHRRFNQNIPSTVVLLQQCHCRNRYRDKLQNLSPPSVLLESSRTFSTIHRRRRRKKMMDQNFEIRIL